MFLVGQSWFIVLWGFYMSKVTRKLTVQFINNCSSRNSKWPKKPKQFPYQYSIKINHKKLFYHCSITINNKELSYHYLINTNHKELPPPYLINLNHKELSPHYSINKNHSHPSLRHHRFSILVLLLGWVRGIARSHQLWQHLPNRHDHPRSQKGQIPLCIL